MCVNDKMIQSSCSKYHVLLLLKYSLFVTAIHSITNTLELPQSCTQPSISNQGLSMWFRMISDVIVRFCVLELGFFFAFWLIQIGRSVSQYHSTFCVVVSVDFLWATKMNRIVYSKFSCWIFERLRIYKIAFLKCVMAHVISHTLFWRAILKVSRNEPPNTNVVSINIQP